MSSLQCAVAVVVVGTILRRISGAVM